MEEPNASLIPASVLSRKVVAALILANQEGISNIIRLSILCPEPRRYLNQTMQRSANAHSSQLAFDT